MGRALAFVLFSVFWKPTQNLRFLELTSSYLHSSLAVVHQWLEANLAALEQTMLSDEKNGDSHQELVEQLKEVLASLGDDTSV